MSPEQKPRLRWRRIAGLLVVAALSCLMAPLSVWAYQCVEEARVARKAAAFLHESEPELQLADGRVWPFTASRTAWDVWFRVENHPTIDAAEVHIDFGGRCSGRYIRGK